MNLTKKYADVKTMFRYVCLECQHHFYTIAERHPGGCGLCGGTVEEIDREWQSSDWLNALKQNA